MPFLEASGKLIFFAHVPKAGGSSVEDYLEARFGPLALLDRDWTARWAAGGWRRSGLRVSPQHLDAREALRLLPRAPDWSFAVVREPAARLISEYRFQARARRPRRRLTRLGFSAWLRLALAAAAREPTIFDNHLRPQSEMVPEGAEVFRLEDGLAPLLARLDAVTGTEAPPGLALGHALKAAAGAPAVRPRPADLALIGRAYAADYARFGYPAPAPARSRPALSAALAPAAALMWRAGRL
jgi:hypothetical protein